jgi:alpha-glucosidase (family GH31 glycosyl hydrolase)
MENGGGGEHLPWKYDEETTDIYRHFVNEHYRLIPYLMNNGSLLSPPLPPPP